MRGLIISGVESGGVGKNGVHGPLGPPPAFGEGMAPWKSLITINSCSKLQLYIHTCMCTVQSLGSEGTDPIFMKRVAGS